MAIYVWNAHETRVNDISCRSRAIFDLDTIAKPATNLSVNGWFVQLVQLLQFWLIGVHGMARDRELIWRKCVEWYWTSMQFCRLLLAIVDSIRFLSFNSNPILFCLTIEWSVALTLNSMNTCRDHIPIKFQAKLCFPSIFQAHCCEKPKEKQQNSFQFSDTIRNFFFSAFFYRLGECCHSVASKTSFFFFFTCFFFASSHQDSVDLLWWYLKGRSMYQIHQFIPIPLVVRPCAEVSTASLLHSNSW